MTTSALIFYPETYIGFNKTQLLERNLSIAGVIGAKFKSSSFYSAGRNFRQFVPKVDSIYKYQNSLIRIQIQAVGVWARAAGKVAILECSNVVLVEGDMIGYPLDRYASLCELLYSITGDKYGVDVAHDPIPPGVSETSTHYRVKIYPDSVN